MSNPQQPSPDDAAFVNQARVREFSKVLGQELLQHLQPIIGQLTPGGRVVQVPRRHAPEQATMMLQTTTPQLLAELNDNLIDLIIELQRSNDLAQIDMGISEQLIPTKRRRRR